MGDPGGIGTFVRCWLHYNNLASSFYKQFGAARKIRDDYEKDVIATLHKNGMEKATIQIGGGSIRCMLAEVFLRPRSVKHVDGFPERT